MSRDVRCAGSRVCSDEMFVCLFVPLQDALVQAPANRPTCYFETTDCQVSLKAFLFCFVM